jgi:hypothetical protein
VDILVLALSVPLEELLVMDIQEETDLVVVGAAAAGPVVEVVVQDLLVAMQLQHRHGMQVQVDLDWQSHNSQDQFSHQ